MLKNLIINNYKWIIFFICLLLFFALAEDVFNHDIMNGDVIGYKFVSTYLIHDSITGFVKMITWCGSATCLILLTIVLFAFIKNKKTGILIGTNLVIITILNQIFKFILQRPRPTEFRIIDETGYSFPSGHSMISMAFYGFLIYLIYKNIKNNADKVTGNKYIWYFNNENYENHFIDLEMDIVEIKNQEKQLNVIWIFLIFGIAIILTMLFIFLRNKHNNKI